MEASAEVTSASRTVARSSFRSRSACKGRRPILQLLDFHEGLDGLFLQVALTRPQSRHLLLKSLKVADGSHLARVEPAVVGVGLRLDGRSLLLQALLPLEHLEALRVHRV